MRALLAALPVLLLCASCRGPDPIVVRHELLAGAPGEPMRVEALVENRSGGRGQVAVVADVTERGTGVLVARESKEIEIDGHGTQGVILELRVPSLIDAAGRQRLEVRVGARYPID